MNTEGVHRETYSALIRHDHQQVGILGGHGFFFAVGANILGWDLFSGWLDRVVSTLPGLVTGLLIILGGFLLSNLARAGISSAAKRRQWTSI